MWCAFLGVCNVVCNDYSGAWRSQIAHIFALLCETNRKCHRMNNCPINGNRGNLNQMLA
jgi:hypothetical protein